MKSRTESLQVARHRLFDLLVIGGGVIGAGIAQNAASRGLSVALVEKDDFGSGSSSRTSQLIQGGYRHLRQFRLKPASQASQEQRRIKRLAPHMVSDFRFVLPLWKNQPWLNIKTQMSLTLHDVMSSTAGISHKSERLDINGLMRAVPALSAKELSGGLIFNESITDDARMVLGLLKSACDEGAIAVNYLQAKSFIRDGEKLEGVVCRDRYTGEDLEVRAKSVINATGVWNDEVIRMADEGWQNKTNSSKSVSIVVPSSAFETNAAVLLPNGDERYVYILPWQHALVIGTTEQPYNGDLNNPLPVGDEIDYLLDIVNRHSHSMKLNRSDISGSFAGCKPVISMSSSVGITEPGQALGEHMIRRHDSGLVTVIGGDLSSYRLLADQVVTLAAHSIPDIHLAPARTDEMMLGGWADGADFLARSTELTAAARRLECEPAVIEHLISNYGAAAEAVLQVIHVNKTLGERICPNHAPIMAEVVLAVQNEMAVCLEDVLCRRVRLGTVNQREVLAAAPKVGRLMQQLLDWDSLRLRAELNALESSIQAHLDVISESVSES